MRHLYYRACDAAWDGDDEGNQWSCGFSAFDASAKAEAELEPDGILEPIWVYEDDGSGNGDFVASLETAEQARALIDRLAELLDLGEPLGPLVVAAIAGEVRRAHPAVPSSPSSYTRNAHVSVGGEEQ